MTFSFLFVGCDEEIEKIIVVDYVEINAGTESTLNIDAGNPPYQITSSDNTIDTTSVSGSIINIKGHKDGETTLLLTDNMEQNVNIRVKVGVPSVEFTHQYTPENVNTLLSNFGVSLEEIDEQSSDDIIILIKPGGASKLAYFNAYEWPIFTSEEIRGTITGSQLTNISSEGIRLKDNQGELYHHYFGVLYNENYYLFHISNVKKETDATGEVIHITGEYKKA